MRFILVIIGLLFVNNVAAQEEAKGMPAEVRKTIEDNLIGDDFGIKITYDGQESKGNFKSKWAPGNQCVVINQEMTKGTLANSKVTGILGWESNTKVMVHRGFSPDGDHFTIRWYDTTGDEWNGTVSGTLNGQAYESHASVKWKGDSFEYRETTLGKPFLYESARR